MGTKWLQLTSRTLSHHRCCSKALATSHCMILPINELTTCRESALEALAMCHLCQETLLGKSLMKCPICKGLSLVEMEQ
eukprot:6485557-Amphidinium_carterae.1